MCGTRIGIHIDIGGDLGKAASNYKSRGVDSDSANESYSDNCSSSMNNPSTREDFAIPISHQIGALLIASDRHTMLLMN